LLIQLVMPEDDWIPLITKKRNQQWVFTTQISCFECLSYKIIFSENKGSQKKKEEMSRDFRGDTTLPIFVIDWCLE
jgi:hypothetical protein